MRVALTEIVVRNAKLPTRGQVTLWDASLPGFGLRISQGGTRSWTVMMGASRRLVTIGRYPVVTLAVARAEAKRVLAEQVLGKRRAPSITFEKAVELFLTASEQRNRPRTVVDKRWLLGRHFLPTLRHRQLGDLAPQEIGRLIDGLSETPSQQNHAFAAARVFFRWAVRNHYLDHNPYDGQLPNRVVPRERVLSDQEITLVFRAAARFGYPYGTIVMLLLLTGQRRGEITALRWEWIDQAQRTITLPAAIAKNNRTHTFPYGPAVADLLGVIPFRDGHLFPASRAHVRGRPTTTFNAWQKSKAAFDELLEDIAAWTLHDLRRTFATNLARLGTSPHVVEKLLNHASGTISGVAAIYNQFQYADEMRVAIAAWDLKLASLMAS
jgi:integrase